MKIDWSLGEGWRLFEDGEEAPFATVQGNLRLPQGPVELRSHRGHGTLVMPGITRAEFEKTQGVGS